MKRLVMIAVVFLMCGSVALPALGGNIVGYGARAVAMGGAFSAIADDGTAFYWNPARLSESSKFSFSPGFGIEGDWDISDDILDLETYPPQFPTLSTGFTGYLGLNSKYAAFNIFGEVSAQTENISEAVSNGTARLDGYGALTLAKSFNGKWGIGINLKAVHSEYSEYAVNVFIDVENPVYNPDNNYITTGKADGTALDFGVYYEVNEKLRFGFVGRNCVYDLNWEGEKQSYNADGTSYGAVMPQEITDGLPQTYTVGVAYQPFKSTLLALDLASYQTDLDDLLQIHFGMEQGLFNQKLAIRLGFVDNGDESIIITTGIGFKLGPVVLDTAAVFADDLENGYYVTLGLDF